MMKTDRLTRAMFAGMFAVIVSLVSPSTVLADGHGESTAWEMSDLKLKLRAKNATSAYSTPVTKEMETLLLYTVDPETPGIAFRCEKGRLYVLLSASATDLSKALREGVRRPRDWELTYQIDDADPVTENWVSMSHSRLFMAHEFASTAAIFNAARDGGTLQVTIEGRGSVTIDIPASEDDLFDYYIESCNLEAAYDPSAGG